MNSQKKKLNVIPPTLRDKKRYVLFSFSIVPQGVFSKQDFFRIILKNHEKIYGLFNSISANLNLINFDSNKKEILIRVNKDNLDDFITGLFFLKDQFGLIVIKNISQTIKKASK